MAVFPYGFRNLVKVRYEIAVCVAGKVMGCCAGKESGAFVDLVKRVGADHGGARAGFHHRLHQREDAFPSAIHRNDMVFRRQ